MNLRCHLPSYWKTIPALAIRLHKRKQLQNRPFHSKRALVFFYEQQFQREMRRRTTSLTQSRNSIKKANHNAIDKFKKEE